MWQSLVFHLSSYRKEFLVLLQNLYNDHLKMNILLHMDEEYCIRFQKSLQMYSLIQYKCMISQ